MTVAVLLGSTGYMGAAVQRACPPGVTLVCVTRCAFEAGELLSIIRDCDPVVVVSTLGLNEGTDEELFASNVEPVVEMLAACRDQGVRFVNLGSAAEYGRGPFSESSAVSPISPYGRSKAHAAQLVNRAADVGLDARTLRLFNVVGSPAPPLSPVREFVDHIARSDGRRPVSVPIRNASTVRDFVPLTMATEAIWTIALSPHRHSVVNLCSGCGVTYGALVEALAAAVLVDVEILDRAEEVPLLEVVGDARLLSSAYGINLNVGLERLAAEAWRRDSDQHITSS
ncbi:MAG: NAD-dependent epimerase/dehydratase family protein [Ilumatobacteraceae bacterium]